MNAAQPFLDAVLRAVPGTVMRLDHELRIRFVNQVRPGFREEDVIGRSIFDFVPPESVAPMRAAIERVQQTGQPGRYDTVGAGENGKLAYYESHVVPVSDPPGWLCLVALDVTAHRERQLALEESEQRLRLTIEATGIGLWRWDATRNEVHWDDRMREIMGRDTPADLATYNAELVHPDDRAHMEEIGRRILETGRWEIAPHRILTQTGAVRWMLVVGRVVKEGDRVVKMLGGNLDITEQKVMEEQLRYAQKLEAIGGLTAGLAHNLNNLLTAIVPAFDLIAEGATPEEREAIEDASSAATRAADLVARLVRFAGGGRSRARSPQDLATSLAHAMSICRRTFERHIVLEEDMPRDLPSVFGEAGALDQVWLNLLLNARDAVRAVTGAQPRIGIRVERDAALAAAPGRAFVRVSITDNGHGMTEGVREKVFEPFFTTKPIGAGTGLGLSTSYAIVRDHGGAITCDSAPGLGTTFSVYLPATSATTTAEKPAAAPPRLTPQKAARVLLVDDEDVVRKVVARVLRAGGHQLIAVATREAALAALAAQPDIDFVLLDRSLPGGPGETFVPAFRQLAPRARIVLFTGEIVPRPIAALVDHVLQKPFRREELLALVEAPP